VCVCARVEGLQTSDFISAMRAHEGGKKNKILIRSAAVRSSSPSGTARGLDRRPHLFLARLLDSTTALSECPIVSVRVQPVEKFGGGYERARRGEELREVPSW